jgi:nucleotide-binding universal stress UspA family protein
VEHLFNKILCPVDLDDHSRAALETARGLAQEPDATIYLLHVVCVAPVIGGVPIEPYAVTGSDVKAEIEQMLPPQAERGLNYQVLARKGNPAAEILRAIGELGVDSVVMATHGRKGIGRLVLGSVAAQVVRESPCPVLTLTAAAIGKRQPRPS